MLRTTSRKTSPASASGSNSLKTSDNHFARLYEKYNELDHRYSPASKPVDPETDERVKSSSAAACR